MGPLDRRSEREVGEHLAEDLRRHLARENVIVSDCFNLYYALSIDGEGRVTTEKGDAGSIRRGSLSAFQVDLAVYDPPAAGRQVVPRVVLELKTGGVTTHDLMLYSTKASRHKDVYPYLRYGLVALGEKSRVHPKVLRHGALFDFMVIVSQPSLDSRLAGRIAEVVAEEVRASRQLTRYLARVPVQRRPQIVRRRLSFEE